MLGDMQSHEVSGGGGATIRVDETGNPDGPAVLFIHGFSQARQSWDKQMESALADDFRLVAMDNRGHGESDKPEDAYADSSLWADDVQAVIDGLDLEDPVLVGWSYGGLIISDYLSVHGDDDIAGVNMVGAISKLGTEDALAVIGDDFLEFVPGFETDDAEESVEALRNFIGRCVYGEPALQDVYYMLGFNAVVPPHVRESLSAREVVHDDDLANLDVPALLTHGEEDGVVLPDAAEEHHDLIPDSEISWYSEVAHAPFWEAPERFNDELAAFVEDANGQ